MEPRESIDLWLSELKADYQESVKLEPDLPAASVLSNPTIQTDVVARDLAQVKAECEQQEQTVAVAKVESDLSAPTISPPANQASEKNLYSGVIDRDLAQIKAEYEREKQAILAVKVASDSQALPVLSTRTIQTSETNLYAGVVDSDLARIKFEYEDRDRASQLAEQKQQQSVQIAQQELQVKTRREQVRQAQVWLKKLDKNSDEGFWFDRFAYKYDCRVEAAIDYLAAVKEI
jgi:hypothetical protein